MSEPALGDMVIDILIFDQRENNFARGSRAGFAWLHKAGEPATCCRKNCEGLDELTDAFRGQHVVDVLQILLTFCHQGTVLDEGLDG